MKVELFNDTGFQYRLSFINPGLLSPFNPFFLTMFCDQMVESHGGNEYGYSENYQLSNKDAGVHKES